MWAELQARWWRRSATRTSGSCSSGSSARTRRSCACGRPRRRCTTPTARGFLEHVLQIAAVDVVAGRAYGANRDVLVAGALLHDIGKLQELDYGAGDELLARGPAARPHHARRRSWCARPRQPIDGFPPRAAHRDRAPGPVAPRLPGVRLAGRADDRRGVHPLVRRRPGRQDQHGAAGDPATTPATASSPPTTGGWRRVFWRGGRQTTRRPLTSRTRNSTMAMTSST